MLFALFVVLQSAASAEVLSSNGRYVAVLTPRAGESGKGARADLVVNEVLAGAERRKLWSGLVPLDRADAAPGTRRDFVTDDGAAFVRIDSAPGELPAVREVLKGTNAAVLALSDLAAEADSTGRWIDLEHGLRWRPAEDGLNAKWMLDLLGVDGLVRTLELDGGRLEVQRDTTRALDLLVHPPVPEPVFPATQETWVDSWDGPRLAYAGATLEFEGHGHDPSESWRFIGFQVVGNPFETRKLVLVPRGVPPQGAAAQVVKPHLWTARVNGLPPGTFEVAIAGRETPAGDARRDPARLDPAGRAVELVTPHLVAELRLAGPVNARDAVALYDDGRLELDYAGKRVLRLASIDDEARVRSRVASLPTEAPRPPLASDVERVGALTWRTKERPSRVLLGKDLSGPARALVDELTRLRDGLDPARATVAYALDPAKSSLLVRTGSAGIFSAFGHDHELSARTFEARFDVDEKDVFRSKVAFSIDATSFHVVDQESLDDAKEIEANMNTGVLESASFPRIEFASTSLALRQGEPAERALAAFAGKEVEVTLTGELTLHGVKKTMRVPGRLSLERDLLRVRGEFALKQTDYGIKPYSAVGGAVKVEDKLRIVYDFQAPRSGR